MKKTGVFKIKHKECGGEIEENWSITVESEGTVYPIFWCSKCCNEIGGDADIVLEDEYGRFV